MSWPMPPHRSARERIGLAAVRSRYAHEVRPAGGPVMGWIIAIIVGGVAGWLASIVMRRDASMGIFWTIIVGIVGALLGNAVLAPLLGFGGSIQTFDLGAFVIAILGAVVLLGIVNLVQRGRVR